MQVIDTIPKLKPRAIDAHKGDFGKVCIIAGSIGMSGAAALAGRAALTSFGQAANVQISRILSGIGWIALFGTASGLI